jgi:hypothetical protein
MRVLLRAARRAPWVLLPWVLVLAATGCPDAEKDDPDDDDPSDDDDAWTAMESGTTAALLGVWGTSPGDVYAVGARGTILHYDGATWSALESGTEKALLAVGGSPASDTFAVGDGGTILRIAGRDVTPMASPTARALYGIWAFSSTDAFAVGEGGTILRYDGEWSATTVSAPGVLADVWGTSPTHVYVTGRQVVYHFDGTSWERERVYLLSEDVLWGVWGNAPKDVLTVGEDEAGGIGLFFRYNGVVWTFVAAAARPLRDVWTSPATGAFAVGAEGTIVGYADGVVTEMGSGTSAALSAVWGSGSDVFAVGAGGTILHHEVPAR